MGIVNIISGNSYSFVHLKAYLSLQGSDVSFMI